MCRVFKTPFCLDAVDDVEDLTAGLSRKIWQKITILENLAHPAGSRKLRRNWMTHRISRRLEVKGSSSPVLLLAREHLSG